MRRPLAPVLLMLLAAQASAADFHSATAHLKAQQHPNSRRGINFSPQKLRLVETHLGLELRWGFNLPEGELAAGVLEGKYVLNEVDGVAGTQRRYHYGGTAALGISDALGSRFLNLDALGSPTQETTSSTGAVSKVRQTDAWGRYRNGTAPAAADAKYGFTGHQFDVESGLTYARARYYDSETGRMLSRDLVDGDLNNAPSLHAYAYASFNPLRYTDPDGLFVADPTTGEVTREKGDTPEVLLQRASELQGQGYISAETMKALGETLDEIQADFPKEAGERQNYAIESTVRRSLHESLAAMNSDEKGVVEARTGSVQSLKQAKAGKAAAETGAMVTLLIAGVLVPTSGSDVVLTVATAGGFKLVKIGKSAIGKAIRATLGREGDDAVKALSRVEGVVVRDATEVLSEEKKLFRGMKETSEGLPKLGPTARELGVRTPPGLKPDIVPDASGMVHPGSHGMSVSPSSPFNLPEHRRPPEFGGTGKDPVWCIGTECLPQGLSYTPDPNKPLTHGFISPSKTMHVDEYVKLLEETQSSWTKQ